MTCYDRSVRVALCLVLAGCDLLSPPSAPAPPGPPPFAPIVLDAHAGATELYGGPLLLMSNGGSAQSVLLSRGRGPIVRTVPGWPIDVVGDHAYVLQPAGDQLRVARVGLDDVDEPLALVPVLQEHDAYRAAVTGGGHVVIIAPESDDVTHAIVIAPDHATRELSLVRPAGHSVSLLVADPAGSTFAILTEYSHGHLAPGAALTILTFVDAATGATRVSIPLPGLSAMDGQAAFIGGKLAIHVGDTIWSYDPATGGHVELFAAPGIDARAMQFSPRGDALAYAHWVHVSDMIPMWVDPVCEIWVVRAGDPRPENPIFTNDGDCRFGTGMLFVGDTLWITR